VQKGESIEPVTWYVGRPPITTLPFPAKDEERPGHYKTPYINVNYPECVKSIIQSPSTIIKQEFSSKLINYPPSDTFIQQLSKKSHAYIRLCKVLVRSSSYCVVKLQERSSNGSCYNKVS